MHRVGAPKRRRPRCFVVRGLNPALSHAHHSIWTEDSETWRLLDKQEVPHVISKRVNRLAELGQVPHRVVVGDVGGVTAARADPVAGQGGEEDLPSVPESSDHRANRRQQVPDGSLVRHHQASVHVVPALPILAGESCLPPPGPRTM